MSHKIPTPNENINYNKKWLIFLSVFLATETFLLEFSDIIHFKKNYDWTLIEQIADWYSKPRLLIYLFIKYYR